MRTPLLVVDANVVVYGLLNHKVEAVNLLTDYAKGAKELVAPELLCMEVCSALDVAYRKIGAITYRQAVAALGAFRKLGITLVSMHDSLLEIMETAKKFNIATYDASYLYLAIELDTTLVTEDKQLISKAGDNARASRIQDNI